MVGIVTEVGENFTTLQPGDRVGLGWVNYVATILVSKPAIALHSVLPKM